MRILINRKPVEGPWGGGNLFVQAAYKYFPEFGYTPVMSLADNPGVILMIDPRPDGSCPGIDELKRYVRRAPDMVQIVHRINECDARKATSGVDQMLFAAQGHRVHKVYVSHWLHRHLEQRWETLYPDSFTKAVQPGDYHIIYNGVDQELFRPMGVGQNWTDKTLIVTHHWSDNPLKGLDVTVWLDEYFIPKYGDRFAYTYIGRLKHQLKNSRMVPPCFGQALADEVAAGEIYVSASRFDPGPNHCLEALSCGLKTFVHKDGGGAVEFAGADHSYGSLEELEKILLTPLAELPDNSAIALPTWRECIEQYAKLFDELTSHMP